MEFDTGGMASGAAAGSSFGPWGTVIGGIGGALISGLFGKDQAEKERARQEEFAKSGIQWRVADAKAAGLHPLFALGAPTFNPSPITAPVPDYSQALQRAAAAFETPAQAELREAQLQVARAGAAKDFAQASYFDSLRARASQANTTAVPMQDSLVVAHGGYENPVSVQTPIVARELGPVGVGALTGGSSRERGSARGGTDGQFDSAKFKANEISSARSVQPEITAGPGKPFWDEYRIGTRSGEHAYGEFGPDRGLYIVLPAGSSASEAIEAISEGGGSGIRAAIYAENVRRYGMEYVKELGRVLRGSDQSIVESLGFSRSHGRDLERRQPKFQVPYFQRRYR